MLVLKNFLKFYLNRKGKKYMKAVLWKYPTILVF